MIYYHTFYHNTRPCHNNLSMSISDLISYMYFYNSHYKQEQSEVSHSHRSNNLAYWAKPVFQTKVNEIHQVKLILYPPSV